MAGRPWLKWWYLDARLDLRFLALDKADRYRYVELCGLAVMASDYCRDDPERIGGLWSGRDEEGNLSPMSIDEIAQALGESRRIVSASLERLARTLKDGVLPPSEQTGGAWFLTNLVRRQWGDISHTPPASRQYKRQSRERQREQSAVCTESDRLSAACQPRVRAQSQSQSYSKSNTPPNPPHQVRQKAPREDTLDGALAKVLAPVAKPVCTCGLGPGPMPTWLACLPYRDLARALHQTYISVHGTCPMFALEGQGRDAETLAALHHGGKQVGEAQSLYAHLLRSPAPWLAKHGHRLTILRRDWAEIARSLDEGRDFGVSEGAGSENRRAQEQPSLAEREAETKRMIARITAPGDPPGWEPRLKPPPGWKPRRAANT